ncbi:hypothetical protein [Anaerocolumna xylanovorans]|uniref:Extracellular solute-binding protein n=1 Tax=Anaerocolumna xylanovorans DSM 12503 TaxID=1121345 RepID=A0A1M7YNA4_9FIRM|nr:hypothetical protein [Anaerocolumna xylanovorans]SHO54067.1 hypothetical protein SAMN02745217_04506 [Anaerocolumna xylanovorans DSM 12503]
MMNEYKLKDSTLDDNAAIYATREEKSEKQKLKEMNFKEKVSYLKDYYLTKTLIGLVALGLAAYFIYTVVTPKPETLLDAAIVNYAFSDGAIDKVHEDLNKLLVKDPKKENIMVDASFYLGDGSNPSEFTIGSMQKLQTFMSTGEIDVIIAPESVFQTYATADFLSKLTDVLPTELLTTLSDSIFNSATDNNAVSGAYGIYLDNTALFKDLSIASDRPVLGILVNSKHQDNGVAFIKYLFDYTK